MDEEIPPYCVKSFEYPEKHYINVTNYSLLLLLNMKNNLFLVSLSVQAYEKIIESDFAPPVT